MVQKGSGDFCKMQMIVMRLLSIQIYGCRRFLERLPLDSVAKLALTQALTAAESMAAIEGNLELRKLTAGRGCQKKKAKC